MPEDANDEQLNRLDALYSWHPFTQMQEYTQKGSFHICKAQGCWLWDTHGNRYLDGTASNWSNIHGHLDPDLKQALIKQLEELDQTSYKDQSHPNATLLCAEFAKIAPEGLTRTFFTDNGSCAIETAIKQSFRYWQLMGHPEKTQCIGLANGYHGDTFGAMSVGNSEGFHGPFSQWFFPVHRIPAPTCQEYAGHTYHADDKESLQALEKLLQSRARNIAFLIMEPLIQGPAGMKLMPYGFLKAVSNLCKHYNVHVILDEIFVGLGRLGTLFACIQENVTPDFLCLSKGLTGGFMPFGVTLCQEAIYQAFLGSFKEGKTFYHGHTFAANPLITAVCLKNIQKLQQQIPRIQETISYFQKAIAASFNNHPYIKEIRQRGLVCALELYPGTPESNFPQEERIAHHITLKLREQGILIRGVGNDLFFIPPLCISKHEINHLVSTTASTIENYLDKYAPCLTATTH